MERLLIIANPAASGFTGAALRAVVEVLSRRYEVSTAWPTSAAGSRQAAVDAAAAGYDVVAALGGDGVAHQVANGLIQSECALAVIPAGTTNVLARIIGLPNKPAKAAAALVDCDAQPTTLVHVTDGSRSDHALFALGIGFDADMVRQSERRPLAKGTIGSLHYVRSTLAVALRDYRNKPPNLRVTCDGDTLNAVSAMVQVHAPYTYFGPVALGLTTDAGAGPTACAITHLSVGRAAAIVIRAALRRNVSGARGVRLWPGFTKLIVEADPPASIQADGDLIGSGGYFEITPTPGAIRMLLPTS